MYSKIIFVLATICIVNASVLTDHDDDNVETEVKVSPSRCNFKACDWLCRSLNKTSGACVNGRCKCEKSLIAKVTELNVDEDSVQSRSCNNKRCNQICRKQKFRGGACVGANCYCNKFLSLQDDTLTDSVENLSPLSCNSIACDDQCRRTGWHSGVCINGQCKCDHFLNTDGDAVFENSFFNDQDPVTPKRCTPEACSALCRRLKLGEGVCEHSRCRCSNYKPTPQGDAVFENSFVNVQDPVTPKRCTPEACSGLCRSLKLGEGVCEHSRCRCSNYKPSPKDAMNDLDESISLDDNFLSNDFLSTEENDPDTVVASDSKRLKCNLHACQRWCRRLGYKTAVCVETRCECSHPETQEDAFTQSL